MGIAHNIHTGATVDIHAGVAVLGMEIGPAAVAADLPCSDFQNRRFLNGVAALEKLWQDRVIWVVCTFAQMAGVYLLRSGYWVGHDGSLVGDRLGNAKDEENEVTALFITTGSATDKTFHMIFAPGMVHRMIDPIFCPPHGIEEK